MSVSQEKIGRPAKKLRTVNLSSAMNDNVHYKNKPLYKTRSPMFGFEQLNMHTSQEMDLKGKRKVEGDEIENGSTIETSTRSLLFRETETDSYKVANCG